MKCSVTNREERGDTDKFLPSIDISEEKIEFLRQDHKVIQILYYNF